MTWSLKNEPIGEEKEASNLFSLENHLENERRRVFHVEAPFTCTHSIGENERTKKLLHTPMVRRVGYLLHSDYAFSAYARTLEIVMHRDRKSVSSVLVLNRFAGSLL